MKLKIFDTKELASEYAADLIIDKVKNNKNTVLGLATGSTPIQTYKSIIEKSKLYDISFAKVKTFNLDEYHVIDKYNEQSYHYFMKENLFSKIDIKLENTYFPSLDQNYDELIESKGGIDIQILGIGLNGHIGFNEPGSSLDSKTRKEKLDQSTITANSRFFNSENEVPKFAITMGIDTILKSKKIVLLAFGKAKYKVVHKLLNTTKFDSNFPASALVLHPDVEIICDKESYEK